MKSKKSPFNPHKIKDLTFDQILERMGYVEIIKPIEKYKEPEIQRNKKRSIKVKKERARGAS